MARQATRLGMAAMIARSARTALRPGSAGLLERAAAVPRMLSAYARGEYRGTTLAHLAMLGAAAFYVVSPVDVMPEALFGLLGLTDDAVVVTWIVAALVADTEAFLQWERSGARTSRTSRTGATRGAAPAGGSTGPQDMPADQWRATARSQVVR